jgi:hypothetical protein
MPRPCLLSVKCFSVGILIPCRLFLCWFTFRSQQAVIFPPGYGHPWLPLRVTQQVTEQTEECSAVIRRPVLLSQESRYSVQPGKRRSLVRIRKYSILVQVTTRLANTRLSATFVGRPTALSADKSDRQVPMGLQ